MFTNNIYWQLMGTLIAVKQKLAPIMDNHDITGVQAHMLISLKFHNGKPMSFLAERLHCDASNITSIVDKLELLGLIGRRTDLEDRRIKLLFLTAKGNSVCQQLISDINVLEAQSLSNNDLSKPAVAEALKALQKFV